MVSRSGGVSSKRPEACVRNKPRNEQENPGQPDETATAFSPQDGKTASAERNAHAGDVIAQGVCYGARRN